MMQIYSLFRFRPVAARLLVVAIALALVVLGVPSHLAVATDTMPGWCDETTGILGATTHKFGDSGACYYGGVAGFHSVAAERYCHSFQHGHSQCLDD